MSINVKIFIYIKKECKKLDKNILKTIVTLKCSRMLGSTCDWCTLTLTCVYMNESQRLVFLLNVVFIMGYLNLITQCIMSCQNLPLTEVDFNLLIFMN